MCPYVFAGEEIEEGLRGSGCDQGLGTDGMNFVRSFRVSGVNIK